MKFISLTSPPTPARHWRGRMLLLSLAAFAWLFGLPGCTMYQNITGYFNTYYNAHKIFDDAVKELKSGPQKDRDSNYFAQYNPNPGTLKKFDSVVVKCSKLIQFYPQSKWVDHSLLMIGESYEYSGESESAIRKFTELLENFPSSDLRFEARLFLAKAKYHQHNDGEALKILKDLFPDLRSEGLTDFLLESLLLEAQIYMDRKEYDQAQQTYALAVEVSGDDDMRSLAQFQLGVTLDSLGQKEQAAEAYLRVTKFSPTFALEYRARLRAGMALTASGHQDAALKIYDKLNGERLRPDEHSLVDLEIANAYLSMGDTATAFPIYAMIDTTYKRTEASTRSMYARAKYFETVLHDYKKARIYYTRARNDGSSAEVLPNAQRRADDFNRYFLLLDNLTRYTVALHRDSVNEELADDDTVIVDPPSDISLTQAELGGTPTTTVIYQPPEAGGQLDRGPGLISSGGQSDAYRRRHIDRDLDPDDGDDVASAELTELAPGDSLHPGKSDSLARGTKMRVMGKPARMTVDSVNTLMAQTYYEFGALFYLQLGLPDSAIYWYDSLLSDYPQSKFVPRTYYALAEVYATLEDTATADSLREVLKSRYGESEYAWTLRNPGVKLTEKNQLDSLDMLYAAAESTLFAGDTVAALRQLKYLADLRPAHHLTSKATYAVGWAYENVVHDNDSATAWYKRMLKYDSTSAFAAVAKPKVAIHDKPESLKDYVKVKELLPEPVEKPTRSGRLVPEEKKKDADEEVDQQDQDNVKQDEDNQDDDDSSQSDDDDSEPP